MLSFLFKLLLAIFPRIPKRIPKNISLPTTLPTAFCCLIIKKTLCIANISNEETAVATYISICDVFLLGGSGRWRGLFLTKFCISALITSNISLPMPYVIVQRGRLFSGERCGHKGWVPCRRSFWLRCHARHGSNPEKNARVVVATYQTLDVKNEPESLEDCRLWDTGLTGTLPYTTRFIFC